MSTKTELQNKITETVESNWKNEQTVLLLSTLGRLDGGSIARYAREHASSLRAFIDTEVPRVKIVEHSRVGALIGVVPKDVTEDTDTILATRRRHKEGKLFFFQHFWKAFRNPLGSNERRFVVLQSNTSPLAIVDIGSHEAPPTPSYEVLHHLIDNNVTNDETYSRVLKWIADTGCQAEDFIRKPKTTTSDGRHMTVLYRLLESLDESEAKRMNIPLDIAEKLSRIPV